MGTAADENHEEAAVRSAAVPVRGADACRLKRGRRTRWNNDGPSEEVSSPSVLLDWLTTEGNYARWRGGENHSGETKAALASQIATLIESRGVTTGRKINDIINKIGQLEQSFRQAVDFLSNTGAGITDETSPRAAIEKRCPHYEVLKDIFGDRPSTRPLLTSDDVALFGDGDDDTSQERNAADCFVTDLATDISERPRQRQRNSPQARSRPNSIRARSPSTTRTISEWNDLSSAFLYAKDMDRESKMRMHSEHMDLERLRLAQTTLFEERRISCAEQETRCRVVLLQAQANREQAAAEREQELAKQEKQVTKMELARNRNRLREEGVPEHELNLLLPLE
ncbi:hypothetical protein BBJ28_00024467 [Nothophytophthora sp. Chile5]|nr:hypothetical protein BBJ28_00024467 [Nothophytophthora sp. Chile5]